MQLNLAKGTILCGAQFQGISGTPEDILYKLSGKFALLRNSATGRSEALRAL